MWHCFLFSRSFHFLEHKKVTRVNRSNKKSDESDSLLLLSLLSLLFTKRVKRAIRSFLSEDELFAQKTKEPIPNPELTLNNTSFYNNAAHLSSPRWYCSVSFIALLNFINSIDCISQLKQKRNYLS